MKSLNLLLAFMSITGSAQVASANEQPSEQPTQRKSHRAGQVIDLGQLEIEGEVRRPNVNWIDSQRRVKDMLPIFHRAEFKALEDQLLRPARIEEIKAKLEREVSHAGN